jgi:pimeloyl-ACP methyl ester carboxylesterase
VTLGRSLGTGVAIEMAKRYLDVAALILISPYTSISAVAGDIRFFGFILKELNSLDKFRNIDNIALVRCPILCIHGMKDKLISHQQTDELRSTAHL